MRLKGWEEARSWLRDPANWFPLAVAASSRSLGTLSSTIHGQSLFELLGSARGKKKQKGSQREARAGLMKGSSNDDDANLRVTEEPKLRHSFERWMFLFVKIAPRLFMVRQSQIWSIYSKPRGTRQTTRPRPTASHQRKMKMKNSC